MVLARSQTSWRGLPMHEVEPGLDRAGLWFLARKDAAEQGTWHRYRICAQLGLAEGSLHSQLQQSSWMDAVLHVPVKGPRHRAFRAGCSAHMPCGNHVLTLSFVLSHSPFPRACAM